MVRILNRIIIVLAVMLITACSVEHRSKNIGLATDPNTTHTGRASSTTASPLFAAQTLNSRSELEADLIAQGIRIFKNGQEVEILIPADAVFVACTPRMRDDGGALVSELSDYLQFYNKVSMDISVYSEKTADPTRSLALTRQQARVFSRYLWEHNLDARVLSANGYGEAYPIANNGVSEGKLSNRRIEIIFRQLGAS